MYKVGDKIRIIYMVGEPAYDGRIGIIENIDGVGQLHGTWGGLAVQPDKDKIEKINCCCICGKEFTDYGNNPSPIKEDGVCCDECNITKVISARLMGIKYGN